MLNDVSIATSGKNSRKQQGVGACPLNSYLGIRMHACARVLPCMARGLLGLGMGASDWDSTPCCFLLFLSLVVISTSISIVDIWLWLDMHACMHAYALHESNGQATNPCCFLLFLPLVVIFTPNSIVDKWLWLKMHACVHVHALT